MKSLRARVEIAEPQGDLGLEQPLVGGVARLAGGREPVGGDAEAPPELAEELQDGIRSPASIREMYAAVQPVNASWRWLRPALRRAAFNLAPQSAGLSI